LFLERTKAFSSIIFFATKFPTQPYIKLMTEAVILLLFVNHFPNIFTEEFNSIEMPFIRKNNSITFHDWQI